MEFETQRGSVSRDVVIGANRLRNRPTTKPIYASVISRLFPTGLPLHRRLSPSSYESIRMNRGGGSALWSSVRYRAF